VGQERKRLSDPSHHNCSCLWEQYSTGHKSIYCWRTIITWPTYNLPQEVSTEHNRSDSFFSGLATAKARRQNPVKNKATFIITAGYKTNNKLLNHFLFQIT